MAKKRTLSVSNTVRREHICSYLEAVKSAKSVTEVMEYVNSKNGWQFNRRAYDRDLKQMTETHGILEVPGHPAGYKVSPDFQRRYTVRLKEEELQALALLLAVGSKQSPDFLRPVVQSLDASLQQALPKDLRSELNRFRDLCVVRGAPSGRSRIPLSGKMAELCEAIRKGQSLRLVYESPYDNSRNKQKRNFGPLALEIFGGTYYLLVIDLDDDDRPQKRLHLSRIRSLEVTNTPYKRTRIENGKWDASFAGLGGDSNEPVEIRVRCGENLGTYLQENEMHKSQKVEGGGRDFVATFRMPAGQAFARFLAGFAWDVKSVEPRELHEHLLLLLKNGVGALEE